MTSSSMTAVFTSLRRKQTNKDVNNHTGTEALELAAFPGFGGKFLSDYVEYKWGSCAVI